MTIKISIDSFLHHRVVLFVKTMMVVSLLLFLQSCSSDESEIGGDDEKGSANLKFDMFDLSDDLIDNSLLYVFNYNTNWANSTFVREQLNITREPSSSKLTVNNMTAGKWNLVLLSSDTDISADIKKPTFGHSMATSLMWETKTHGGFLNDMSSEFRYAPMNEVNVTKDVNNTANAILGRNVVKVQVILKEHNGFNPTTPSGYIELLNVPKQLNWEGKFLNPSVGNLGIMHKNLVFQGQKADTLDFILPADRGTTTSSLFPHEIKLKACMFLADGTPYFGSTESGINIIDKATSGTVRLIPNDIIQITINKFSGEPETELNIEVYVKEWENETTQKNEF